MWSALRGGTGRGSAAPKGLLQLDVLDLVKQTAPGHVSLVDDLDPAAAPKGHGELAVVPAGCAAQRLGDIVGIFAPRHPEKRPKRHFHGGAFFAVPIEAQQPMDVEIGFHHRRVHGRHPDAHDLPRAGQVRQHKGLTGGDFDHLIRFTRGGFRHHSAGWLAVLAGDQAQLSAARDDKIGYIGLCEHGFLRLDYIGDCVLVMQNEVLHHQHPSLNGQGEAI